MEIFIWKIIKTCWNKGISIHFTQNTKYSKAQVFALLSELDVTSQKWWLGKLLQHETNIVELESRYNKDGSSGQRGKKMLCYWFWRWRRVSQAREYRQTLEDEKGKEVESPLEPPKWTQIGFPAHFILVTSRTIT